MILPAEEQLPEVLEGLQGFPPMPRGEARIPQALEQLEQGQADARPPLRVLTGEPVEGDIVDLPGGLTQRGRRQRR